MIQQAKNSLFSTNKGDTYTRLRMDKKSITSTYDGFERDLNELTNIYHGIIIDKYIVGYWRNYQVQ